MDDGPGGLPKREAPGLARLVEELRAREAAEAEELAALDQESGASPYREAEAIARDLYRGR